ncbi:MAG: Rieske 2Fe-2S domain-containing protein [Hyphomonadaceae bacterium]|nr:Rieske 2Fe-2S domain-containing protein [Hyphomonadaceae bacterium]MBC6412161.1 Rieske 2Fe-2S domain-containing protein [Hyphomonadaceae bacterium]
MDAKVTQSIKDGMAYERARTGPPEGFPALPPVPGRRYVDPSFNRLEFERMWKRSWVYACHLDEIPEPGSYYLWDRLGSAILIVRGEDDGVCAFYNTCRHRGGPLVKDRQGRRKLFVCGYHGWSYDREGNLIAVRDERDFPDFDRSCLKLISVKCETFGNWVFVNFDDQAGSLKDYLGPVAQEMTEFQPDKIRLAHKAEWDVDCNVKVLLDAFLETYHLKSIHQQTVDRFLDHLGTTIELWPNGHSRMVTPNRRPEWKDPGVAGLPEIATVGEIARDNNVSYNIYPNIVCPPAPTGMPFILFWPKTDNTMLLECIWFSPDWGAGPLPDVWDTRVGNFERIIAEDTQFAPQIQQSVESDGFRGIHLSCQERRIYHWHEELDRRIGREGLPESAAVEQILGPFVTDPYESACVHDQV